MKEFIKGANPYMPLWEHVPDGEPRVFEYNGEKRVYVYGSHDIEVTQYCGRDYVVWSAPVDDLTNWTCHGVAYKTHYDSVLYAPDVVKKGDTYYMYAAERCGSLIVVASSKTPWGPFENPVETKLGFDPGVLVDEDGKVYAYWGGCAAPCYIAELEEDMATIKEETLVSNPLGHSTCPWNPADDGHISLMDGFFEASSPRKVMGKYVYIYSKRYEKPVPELGVYTPNNGFLSYRFSESPFGPFHDGGDISFNGGEILKDAEGCGTMTYQWGNNHGSIMEINGAWYVFYHRQTGVNEYSRQAMLEPVDVAMGQDGKLYIGNIKFLNGEPVASGPVEMTSQGPHINGLDAYKWISAGYACHIHGSSTRAYIRPGYEKSETISTPVVDLSSGTTVGFRYLQFGNNTPKQVQVVLGPHKKLTVNVRTDSYQGRIIASMDFSEDEREKTTELISAVTGKHAVYFEFLSEESGAIAEFDRFCFDLSSINHIRLEMDKTERAELTVLCLLCHGDSLLLQNRVKEDWKGYALPGGHVEPGESFVDAVIREMKEETGLTIRHPKLCGIKQFPIENGRYFVLLFQTDEFSGELVSSDEGKMEWVQRNRLSSVNLVSDLRELLRVMEDDSLTEFQYVIEENEWKAVLK